MRHAPLTLLALVLALVSIPCLALAQDVETELDLFETMREGDQAVVVAVHVGASDAASRQCIQRFNNRLQQAYPSCLFREAWTSRPLISQFSADGVSYMPTPDELFSQLHKEGYTHVLVQSSCVANDHEMQYLRHAVDMARPLFKQIRLGEPLLSDATDYEEAIKATAAAYGKAKEANVLVCDAASSTQSAPYTMLDYTLHDKNFSGWYVGTTQGYPSFDSLVRQLKQQKAKKVNLIPFLFADDAQGQLDILHDWAQRLQKAGYKVTTEAHYLGDLDGILDIFENHLRHAARYRTYSAKELKMLRR